jgi:atypical dual specificity phosphatase
VTVFPEGTQRWINYLAFWPTVVLGRILCAVLPCFFRVYDEVLPGLYLGAVPCFESDVQTLHDVHNVRATVNLCEEWRSSPQLYRKFDIKELHLPTLDHHPPTLESIERACEFIDEQLAQHVSVYVHCKAGRSRSAIVVLCYLVKTLRISPKEAHVRLLALRPRINRRFELPVVSAFAARHSASAVDALSEAADGRHSDDDDKSNTTSSSSGSSLPPRLQRRA